MIIGYIVASNDVMKAGKNIGHLYREQPDEENDSGWRVFSGEESQEYTDDPNNFAMYNATTIIASYPEIIEILGTKFPVMYERNPTSGKFIQVGN